MVTGELQDPVPIEFALSSVNDVGNVGAVETFSAGDKDFRCYQLFGGKNPGFHTYDYGGRSARDPGIFDDNNCVAHPGDQIDVKIAAMSFGQPHRVPNLAFESGGLQTFKSPTHVLRSEEEIEIFSVAPDAGVMLKGEGSRDRIGYSQFVEHEQNFPVKPALFFGVLGLEGTGNRQRLVLLVGHEALGWHRVTFQLPHKVTELLVIEAGSAVETGIAWFWQSTYNWHVTFRILENTNMDQVDRAIAEQKHAEREVDANWISDRIAVGGWVETPEKMQDVAQSGITHILSMAWEFDETELAEPYGITVFLNTVDDDFAPKSPEVLKRGVEFARSVLEEPGTKLLIHCVAGRHRGPMMTLAVLCALGWNIESAMRHISDRRPVVDWTPVYVESVRNFLLQYGPGMRTADAATRIQPGNQHP